MKKLLTALFSTIFLLGPSIAYAAPTPIATPLETATTAATPAEVHTFELFWPVAAGKVKGESFYFLKSVKESVREFFIFGSYEKADYNIVLSEKRVSEAEKLLFEKHDYSNFSSTLEIAQQKRLNAYNLIKKVSEGGTDTASLKTRLTDSLTKQEQLLTYWNTRESEKAGEIINQDLSNVRNLISELAK